MNPARTIALTLALAATAFAPAVALAKHGADDATTVPDDKGGQVVKPAADDHPSAADDKGGQATQSKHGGSTAKRVTGTCTGNSTAKLKVKPDDGRLETEFEVDQNRSGVTWKVRIHRTGHLAVKKNATTKAPSGSFSVERRLTNGSGADRISARATSPSGQVCTASVTV